MAAVLGTTVAAVGFDAAPEGVGALAVDAAGAGFGCGCAIGGVWDTSTGGSGAIDWAAGCEAGALDTGAADGDCAALGGACEHPASSRAAPAMAIAMRTPLTLIF